MKKNNMKEFALYALFGCGTVFINTMSFALFTVYMGINELIANVFAWALAVLFAFVTNKRWVFKSKTPTKTAAFMQMFAFFTGRTFTLVLEEIILLVFITILAYPTMWVKIPAQVIVIALNYVISKRLVFTKK